MGSLAVMSCWIREVFVLFSSFPLSRSLLISPDHPFLVPLFWCLSQFPFLLISFKLSAYLGAPRHVCTGLIISLKHSHSFSHDFPMHPKNAGSYLSSGIH